MSVWSEEWDKICRETEDPVQRIVKLAKCNVKRGSVFLDGDQGPAFPTMEQLQQAGELLAHDGLQLSVYFGGMMGPQLHARRFGSLKDF